MGEDQSFTPEENALLVAEVEKHRDILIAPYEEAVGTDSGKTKHCIYWATHNHDFDILIKTKDDSMLFLSRLVGDKGWLRNVSGRRELIYFGKKHALAKVANPDNLEPNELSDTNMIFEFDYRGMYWPEYMEGGMFGLSRRLAEEMVKNDFRTYTLDDAMVGVWVSALGADIRYMADEQVLSREVDYLASNGTSVAATFQTDLLRLASMWCEYALLGSVSPGAIVAEDREKALDCLGALERSMHVPRSLPLGDCEKHHAATLAALKREWPIKDRPDVRETGQWWSRVGGVFRGKAASLVGTSTTRDRLPLYLLQGMHTLVLDDFFRVAERYASWEPTMYMCVDPELCASRTGAGDARRGQSGAANVESANRFARTVSAAFFVLSGGVVDSEYWRYLRQRTNAHWFVAGAGEGAAGMGTLPGASTETTRNFLVSSRASGVSIAVEVLSYLGFSPIFVTAAREQLETQWEEVERAIQLVTSAHGTEVVYLYADEEDKLPEAKVGGVGRGDGAMSAQEDILKWAKRRSQDTGNRSETWDLDLFLQHFPVLDRLKIFVDRRGTSIQGLFPRSPLCRDAEDLDRFQKIVLCSVKISLRHFPSFLTWHVPYGPVRNTFVWVKR